MEIVIFKEVEIVTSSTLVDGGTSSDQEIDFGSGFN